MTVIYNRYGTPRVNKGDMVVIKTNGAVAGGVGPYTLSAQWYRDGAPIDGATDNQYSVTDIDVGHTLICIQTAEDSTGRTLQLRPSNQILVGKVKRGARPNPECPPGTTPNRPMASKVVPAISRTKPAPISQPTREQLKAEVKRAKGGCKSCAERAKARSRRNNP
jgi:hypothetical protein